MPIEITARRAGFRRCGIAHAATPTVYADGTFSAEQLAMLQHEPMLMVRDLAETVPETPDDGPESLKAKGKGKTAQTKGEAI